MLSSREEHARDVSAGVSGQGRRRLESPELGPGGGSGLQAGSAVLRGADRAWATGADSGKGRDGEARTGGSMEEVVGWERRLITVAVAGRKVDAVILICSTEREDGMFSAKLGTPSLPHETQPFCIMYCPSDVRIAPSIGRQRALPGTRNCCYSGLLLKNDCFF